MQDLVIMEIKPQYKENMSGKTDIRRLTKELRKDFENPYYCLLVWNHKDRHGVKSRLHPVIIMQNYVR